MTHDPDFALVDFEQDRLHAELGDGAGYDPPGEEPDPDDPGLSYLALWESPDSTGRFHVRAVDLYQARVAADKLVNGAAGQRVTSVRLAAS